MSPILVRSNKMAAKRRRQTLQQIYDILELYVDMERLGYLRNPRSLKEGTET